MISVIMPLGQRHRRWTFWVARGVLYIAASALSGALVGGLVAAIGGVAEHVLPAVVLFGLAGLLGLAYGLHELGIFHLPHPEHKWQVPNEWIARRPLFGAVAFGLTIGAGVFTFIPFTSFYVLLAWELALGNVWAGALLGAAYGLARGLPVITGGVVTGRGGSIVPVHLRILGATPGIHRATAGLLVLSALALGLPLLLGH